MTNFLAGDPLNKPKIGEMWYCISWNEVLLILEVIEAEHNDVIVCEFLNEDGEVVAAQFRKDWIRYV